MFDDENVFDEDRSDAAEELWSRYGFSEHEAWTWVHYGFDEPERAAEWRDAVEHPEVAEVLFNFDVPVRQAAGWGNLIAAHGEDFPLEEAYRAVGGSVTLAIVYNRHFPVAEWDMLNRAGISARMVASVFQLSSAIDARDHHRGLSEDRGRSIREAAQWVGDSGDLTLSRASLLQNIVLQDKNPADVPFVLMDTGGDAIKDIAANRAIQVNDWVAEAGYAADERGLAAYRVLAGLDAAPHRIGQLIRRFGPKEVLAAMEAGLTTFVQLQHHLKHGGVAEIARGVL